MSCCDLLTTLPASPSPDLHTCVCMDTCKHTRISLTWALLFSRLWLGYCTLLLHTGWLSICTCTCALPGAGVYPVACKGEHCTAPCSSTLPLESLLVHTVCFAFLLWLFIVASFSELFFTVGGGIFLHPFLCKAQGRRTFTWSPGNSFPTSLRLFSAL